MLEQSWQIRTVETLHWNGMADSVSQDFLSFPQGVGGGVIGPKEAREHSTVLLDLAAEEYPAEIDLFLRLADKPCDSGGVFDLEVGPVTVNVAEAELFREARSTS